MRSSRLVGVLALVFLVGACGSSGADVPGEVARAFEAEYPDASPEWRVQPYGYEAVYTEDGQEYEVEYSGSGEWLETEFEVSRGQFSPLVLDRVRRENPGYAITKREIELTPRGTFYEVEVEGEGQQIEYYFDDQARPAENTNEDA